MGSHALIISSCGQQRLIRLQESDSRFQSLLDKHDLSPLMTKPTMWLCVQRRLRSAWATHFIGSAVLWLLLTRNEPSREIMVLFVFHKLILQTRMHSHPVGLDVSFLVGAFVYFYASCVQTAKTLARLCWSPV